MQRDRYVDFHCHSDVSDGYFSPESVAQKLAAAGVRYAALTDHDTVAGLARFQLAAERRGVVVVSGVEVTALYEGREVHILAYGFDPKSRGLHALFTKPWGAVEAIARIHDSGGKAFLAHPLDMGLGEEELDRVVRELAAAGLDGLEAYHKGYPVDAQDRLAELAADHGLLTTGGSDFHGQPLEASIEPGVVLPAGAWKRFREAVSAGGWNGTDREGGSFPGKVISQLDWRWFSLRIVLPSLLVAFFFLALLFGVLIPTMSESLLDRKRDMTRELTNSAWSILAEYQRDAAEGRLTQEEAQQQAIERVRHLRYGKEGKDYFWITDMHPRMVMHPYRPDLDGQDLTDFRDVDGVRLFVEFADVAREEGRGYVDYIWQWQDDPTRLAAKESYVRAFEPWGWVIGTGIYVEDVQEEIDAITGRAVSISMVVSLFAGLLLLTVMHQTLKVERRRSQAERDLRASHEKYRTLAESASEGTLMLLDRRCTYANPTMLETLGYSPEELAFLEVQDVLAADDQESEQLLARLDAMVSNESPCEEVEATLRCRDGERLDVLLAPTRIMFGGRAGLIISVRDVARQRAVEQELGASRAQYRALVENIDIGVFRAVLDDSTAFVELNPAARRILGLAEGAEARGGLKQMLADADAADQFFGKMNTEGAVKDMILQVRRADGSLAVVSLSAVPVRAGDSDSATEVRYCDGVMEDISERRCTEAERENLISQLQTSLLFLNEPVRNSMFQPISCPMDVSVEKAAALMSRHGFSAVLGAAPGGEVVGIATDRDLCERVVAAGLDTARPLYQVMSSPVVGIDENAPIYEAFLLMREKNTRHLAVRDSRGEIVGIVRNKELVRLDRYSPVVLASEIKRARTLEDLEDTLSRLQVLVGSLIDSGALPRNVCRVVTAVSDAVTEKLIGLALEELGPAPLRFAFVALGSEGREEQTLATDQDNALIYEDPPAGVDGEAAADYFLELGRRVCDMLDAVGYAYCEGDMMARNPSWNQPLSTWKDYFTRWIKEPEDAELLKFNIFFDFRYIYGDSSLTRDLRRHVDGILEHQPAFFLHMAGNTLHYRPPVGVFGQIITGSAGSPPDTFDVKAAMLPIIGFARLYALQSRVEETNTLDRLDRLRALKVLREDNHQGIYQAYSYLMELRYKHQVQLLREGQPADNSINPKKLSQIEVGMVKEAFSQITAAQKKVSFDFRGAAG